MKLRKIAALALSAIMLASSAACTGSTSSPTQAPATQKPATQTPATQTPATQAPATQAATPEPAPAVPASVYPIPGNKKLTYWMNTLISNWNDNNAKLPMYQELMKLTGVQLEFIHPVVGQTREGFNLMIASNDYPDIIESSEQNAGALLEMGVIIDLSDIIPQYSPAYYSYLQENPNVERQVKNDAGQLLFYPFIRPEPILQVSSGPIVRLDWLEDLKLNIPVTFDDWEVVLTAFKNEKGATAPYATENTTRIHRLMYGFGTSENFMDFNGKVEYGFMLPGTRDFIEKMSDWYAKGLIDQDYMTGSRAILDSNILSGKTGMTDQSGGGGLGTWMTAAPDDKFKLLGVGYPKVNASDPTFDVNRSFEFANTNGWCMISSQCKDVETAAKLLDFGYTEEGWVLYNFGIEGVSYTIEKGEYTYTPAMFNDPQRNISDTMGQYVRSTGSGPFLQAPGYILQYYQLDLQKQSLYNWLSEEDRTGGRRNMPPVVLTTDEAAEYRNIMADVDTYRAEEMAKFIMGTRSPSTFDAFVDQLKAYKIERAIEIQQAGLNRFYSR